jgi:hypothetical protein
MPSSSGESTESVYRAQKDIEPPVSLIRQRRVLLSRLERTFFFNSPGPPTGWTFDAMMRNFESSRDKAFASHDCAKHPRKSKPPADQQ